MPVATTTLCSSTNPTSSSPVDPTNSNSTSGNFSDDYSSVLTFPSLPSLCSLFSSSSISPYTTSFLHLTSLKPLSSVSSPPALAISPSSLIFYTASPSNISIYNLESLELVSEHPSSSTPSAGAVKSLIILPKWQGLLSAHQDGLLRLWRHSSKSGNLRLAGSLPTLSDRLLRLPFPKNYTPIRRHHKRLWIQHADTVSALAASGDYIYSVSWDKTLKIWRSSDLKCIQSISAHDDAINALIVSSNGTVYTGSADTRIRVWVLGEKKHEHTLLATLQKHRSAVNALAISTNGSLLYSGANDRSILVWERDQESGTHMSVIGALRGHTKAILCLSSVDDMLFSGSSDRTVRIWRRGRSEGSREYSCLAVMNGHDGVVKSIMAVRFLKVKFESVREGEEEEYRVCSSSLDGEVKVWQVQLRI